MEVENKAKQPSFPSNYVTIHQLRQRWLQQHQSPSSLPSTVIPESNHRDEGDVIESSSAAADSSKKTPQNDAASAHSPLTKSPSSYNNNKNNKPPFSSISSSSSSSSSNGGFKKKAQNDAVSPPPAKTKSPSSSSSQQQSSSLSLPTTVISESTHRDKPQNDAVSAHSPSPPVTKSSSTVVPESNHRDDDDDVVEASSAASKKPPQNDTVSARFSKAPSSFYARNKTRFSSISSSSSGGGGLNEKPQSDAVSPSPPLSSQQNPHYRIASKTLKETIFGKGRGPHRAPTSQKPEPEHTDSIVVTTTTTNNNTLGTDIANDVTDKPISVSNDNQLLKKKKRKNKKKNHKRDFLPDQSVTGASSLSETDPKPELVVVVGEKEQESGDLGGGRKPNKTAVGEMKMGQELEEVERKQKPRELRGCRNWGKKGEGEFKVKTASFDQNKPGVGDDNVVKPKLEVEMEMVVEKEKESRELGGSGKSNKKAVRESKIGQELENVVVVVEKKQQQLRERKSRGCRNWNKKRVTEFKDKTALFDQTKQAVAESVVEAEAEPELEVEMEVVVWKGQESPESGGSGKSNKVVRESKIGQELEEVVVVVVEKKQKPRESKGRRDLDKKAVWEFKPKTASFGQYDYNINNVDVGGGGGVKDVEADKVVGNGNVVKENSRHASGKLNLQGQGQGQGQGKQSKKAASFDQDQDTSESPVKESITPVKERDVVNTNYNSNSYYRNRTGNVGSNWRMGSGRFRGHGIQRPSYSKPLIATGNGGVWVKKEESVKPNLSSSSSS